MLPSTYASRFGLSLGLRRGAFSAEDGRFQELIAILGFGGPKLEDDTS